MKEVELLTAEGLGGIFKGQPAEFILTPGQLCLNCATELKGRYCHVCSQDARTHHHRTVWHLIIEAFEGLFHFDGRLWRTLPPLFFTPGSLAKDLLEGKMARHVPPFRIFLVALLVFMLVAENKSEQLRHDPNASRVFDDTGEIHVVLKPDGSPDMSKLPKNVSVTSAKNTKGGTDYQVNRTINLFAMSPADARYLGHEIAQSNLQPKWLKAKIMRALEEPEVFFTNIFTWGHRLALLLLPTIGLVLGLMYLKRRDLYFYDHLLVGMNMLSVVFWLYAGGLILPNNWVYGWRIAAPVWIAANFYSTLRVAYGSSVLWAFVKTFGLLVMTGVSFLALLLGVVMVSLGVG